jgi:AraC-like DNA-binding protein
MIREYFARLFRLAWAETREGIRQDRERCPKRFAPLFRAIEEQLFEPGFNVQAARRQSGILQATPPLGRPLSSYLAELRIKTAQRMFELADGRIPTGRIAAAVGMGSYLTWRRTFRRFTGEWPPLIHLPDRLPLRFDDVSWHHACRGGFSQGDTQTLIERLRRLYPQGWGNDPLPAQFPSLDDLTYRPGTKCGGISDSEARSAVLRAAEEPLLLLELNAKGLPEDLGKVLADVAKHLFDPALEIGPCRERAGVRDTSVTTRLSFFLGDTFADLVERRRIETAVGLIADRRFTLDRLAEEIGMSYRSFSRVFPKRTGANGSDIRKTLLATADHTAYDLWSRAEGCGLTRVELRTLIAYLRGLHSENQHRAAQLAVRADVDPRRVEEVLQFDQAIVRDSAAAAKLESLIQTHPRYSAAHWYVHWIRDRLGQQTVDSAWIEWQQANRDLGDLLAVPRDQRSERLREDRRFHREAFLWLLVDCVSVRLFQDVTESEHFADLAVAVTETCSLEGRRTDPAGLFALALALKGHALQRRSEYAEAEKRFALAFQRAEAAAKFSPWIEGRVNSLYASLLDRTARHREAKRRLFAASTLFKQSGDNLERLRCVVKRCSAWYSLGRDPVRLLTRCIDALEEYPFATSLIECAHLNRLEASIYLSDRLTGTRIFEINTFRSAMPVASSPFTRATYSQMDGLIAALEGRHADAVSTLRRASEWFQGENLLSHSVVCRLQYSWALADVDQAEACRVTRDVYSEMKHVGFRAHGLQDIALRIYEDARQGLVEREALRRCILSAVLPTVRLTEPAGPKASNRPGR